MTISNENNRTGPLACTGTTGPYSSTFKITDADDVKVTKTTSAGVETVLTRVASSPSTDEYTVSGVGSDTFSVTTGSAYAAGNTITLSLDMTFTQPNQFTNQQSYRGETHEGVYDKTINKLKQLREELSRSLQFVVSADLTSFSVEIPDPTSSGGDVIGINSAGTGLQLYTPNTSSYIGMPASSTDNTMPRFDGTTGKVLQAGQTVEDDSGNLIAAGAITATTGLVAGTDVNVGEDLVEPDYVTVASAGTVALGTTAGRKVLITGTTTITAFNTVNAGIERKVKFGGTLTLTHNGTSLILPGAANITTAAGDTATFVSEGSGNWRCTGYQKADGTAVVSPSSTDQVARDMAASALAYTMAQNDAASITGTIGKLNLSDDFETDSLATKTNATYDATGDYYHNGATGSYTQSVPYSAATAPGTTSIIAQSFQVSTTDEITKFKIVLYGTSATIDFTIETDSAGAPSGTLVDANAKADAVSVSGSLGSEQEISLDAAWAPSTGTTYWLVARNTGGGNIPGNVWAYNGSAPYASGTAYVGGSAQSYDMGFGIFQVPAPSDMTLAPTAVTIDTADPTDILAYVVVQPVDSITVGTDIVMTASIDGGTTDATGAWTKVGDIGSSGEELWRVEADVSAQTGSSLTYEITTANSKEIQYHDCVGLVALY